MKGLIILIVILAVLGIWWAKRTPEPIGTFQPESANAENEDGTNIFGDDTDESGDSDTEEDVENKG